jgi:hypothetical protein
VTIPPEMLGQKQVVSREQAALQQITMAIRLLHEREFASAITLALAAEDQIPETDQPHLLGVLRHKAPGAIDKFNEIRNWLKHSRPPDEQVIYEFEVVVALMRATSKFLASYRAGPPEIEKFVQWCRDRGYTFGSRPEPRSEGSHHGPPRV